MPKSNGCTEPSFALFEETKTILDKKFLSRDTISYSTASRYIFEILTELSTKYSEKSHPITILIDSITSDYGHICADEDSAWIFINVDRMVTDDWPAMSEDDIKLVIFRVAQTFAHEMGLYKQYLRNWAYYEGKTNMREIEQLRVVAEDAARELLRYYKNTDTITEKLRHNLNEAITYSPSLKSYMSGDRCRTKRFLSVLYRHLHPR